MEQIKLPKLRLPEFDPKISWDENRPFIWDEIRKKNVFLTPEEWVRQHFLRLMTDHLKYPKSLISVEKGHKYLKFNKRTDIQVLDHSGAVWLLVECKGPKENLAARR